MYLLFTTKTCPNCPRAKELLETRSLPLQMIDASETEGLNIAKKYKIMNVPSLIEINDAGEVLEAFHGLEDIENFTNLPL